jgi:hypothetical protein
VSFYISDIFSVNTADQSFKAGIFVRYRWKDQRLAHNNSETITRPLSEIWHPNIQILNQQKLWRTSGDHAAISSDGTVTYRFMAWGTFSQRLALKDFPFDKQLFTFQVFAAGFQDHDIEFVGEPGENGRLAFNIVQTPTVPDWKIGNFYHEAASFKPVHNLELYLPGVTFSFEAERLTSYFIVKMILPLILIVAMSWAVFWMDPLNAASNVGISITSMLTLVAYLFSINAILPRLSYLTSLDYFILASTVLVFLSLTQGLITSTLARQGRMVLCRRIDIASRIGFPLVFFLLTLETLILRTVI